MNPSHSRRRFWLKAARLLLLDIDFGTYLLVTSWTPSAGGISTGLRIAPRAIGDLIGVVLIKPSELAELEGENLIIFEIDSDDPPKNFFAVLRNVIAVCTGKKIPEDLQNVKIDDIPVTRRTISSSTTTIDDVYIIEMRGTYSGMKFNNERLMGMKNSNYLQAILGKKEWRELGKNNKDGKENALIEGSKLIGFHGNYTEFSSSGFREGNMKLGFRPLMQSLHNLFTQETVSKVDFFTVCVNLFEPPRFPFLAREIIQYPFGERPLSPGLGEILNQWKNLSASLIKCQKDKKNIFVIEINEIVVKVYTVNGAFQYRKFTEIRRDDLYLLLGMAKCG